MSTLKNCFLFFILGSLFLGAPFFHFKAQAQARERLVNINDNGILFKARTKKSRVKDLLLDLDIKLNPKDIIFPSLNSSLGDKIFITRAVPIILKADGKIKKVFTFQDNAAHLLEENKIKLQKEDKINYLLNQRLFSNMEIIVTRVEKKMIRLKKEIGFAVQTKKDPNLLLGQKKIVQSGKKGLKEEQYLIIYEDGQEVQRVLQKTKVLKRARPKIIVLGAKIKVGRQEVGQASFVKKNIYQGLSAAHKTWPLGRRVKVINLENKKSVIVKIIDRGPFIKDRIIDLSSSAFQKIASLGQGVIPVRIEEILN